jgi:hypothetical protein
MHLNWVFSVASSLLPASFEEFRHPNLNAEQLIGNLYRDSWREKPQAARGATTAGDEREEITPTINEPAL